MRTNIVLDEALMAEAAELTGIKTKREIVHEAIKLLIATKKRKRLGDLRGRIEFAEKYDYKKARQAK